MENLNQYIKQLKQDEAIWDKIEPLVDHIAFLEAELRLARLRLDDPKPVHEVEVPYVFSSVKSTQRNKTLSLEERNLYRAVGELAFVIAKADNILRNSEKKAFQEVIVQNFGQDSWIAEDRFNLIANTPASNVESTYNHVIFLIRQNKGSLTQGLVDKFIHVIRRVAEVANVHETQERYIDRFKEDLLKIYDSQ